MKADPIGLKGGLNFYMYVYNNPVNYFDPWGLEALAGVGEDFVPDNPWIHKSTSSGGSMAHISFTTTWGSTNTDVSFTNDAVGVSFFSFRYKTDLPCSKNIEEDVSYNIGLGDKLGISYYPKSGDVSVNIGVAVGAPIGLTVPLVSVDNSQNSTRDDPYEGPMM